MTDMKKIYGHELVMDLHECDPSTFNRPSLNRFFEELCDLINMEKCDIHFWDDVGVPIEDQQSAPHTKGTSAVCFILTSTIVIHTLDILKTAYVNIFSCKEFDSDSAKEFTEKWFGGRCNKSTLVERTL